MANDVVVGVGVPKTVYGNPSKGCASSPVIPVPVTVYRDPTTGAAVVSSMVKVTTLSVML